MVRVGQVAELVYALVLGTSPARVKGSSPFLPTVSVSNKIQLRLDFVFIKLFLGYNTQINNLQVMIEIKEILEEKDWTPEVITVDVPIPQSWWYGEAQKKRGRQVRRYVMTRDGTPRLYVQWIEYPLISVLGYWYAPYGPVSHKLQSDEVEYMKKFFADHEDGRNLVFMRFDFYPALDSDFNSSVSNEFRKASASSSSGSYYQPRNEWFTDISGTPDEILSSMHQKTRYSVRLAEKKGVEVTVISGKDLVSRLPDFMNLMKSTAKRNKFTLHDDFYYKVFFDEVASRSNGFLIEARYEGELLASHMIIISGTVAHFVFGGTSDSKKDLCAPYLAHFAGMKESKLLGARSYNFGGISVSSSVPEWEGVTVFKKKFGGAVVTHSPYFDLVLKPLWYFAYNFRKLLRKYL